MEKKIPIKSLYLLAVIAVGLVILGAGSTYAMFTATATIDNPIYLASSLSYGSDIIDTIDITTSPGEVKSVMLKLNNNSGYSSNYAVWYIDNGFDVSFGIEVNELALTLGCNTVCNGVSSEVSDIGIKVYIRNDSDSIMTTTIGVTSGSDNIVLSENMKIIPNKKLEDYVTSINNFEYTFDTYVSDNEVLITKYIGNREDVVIPSSYVIDGKTYNTVLLSYDENIDSGVFCNNYSIKHIDFNDGIKFIGIDKEGNILNNSINNLFKGSLNGINVSLSDNSFNYNMFNEYITINNLNNIKLVSNK